MEIKATLVCFKSTPENYKKEKSGQKPNTIRKLSKEDEELLSKSRIKWISIKNEETGESVLNLISDITKWDDWYIFSWIPFEKPQPVEYKGLEVMHNG
jgi:hypothetical protein